MRLRNTIKVWDGCHYCRHCIAEVVINLCCYIPKGQIGLEQRSLTTAFNVHRLAISWNSLMAVGFAEIVRAISMLRTAPTGQISNKAKLWSGPTYESPPRGTHLENHSRS